MIALYKYKGNKYIRYLMGISSGVQINVNKRLSKLNDIYDK